MKPSFRYILSLICMSMVLVACDDNTSTLGFDMMPETDFITKTFQTYDVKTSSFEVGDSVLARTSTSYIGNFSDPITGVTIKSNFITQFYPQNSNVFPKVIDEDSLINWSATLYCYNYSGDSLATFNVEVYSLDSLLDPNKDYYTNINPEKFVAKGAKPLGHKWFTLQDSIYSTSDGGTSYHVINIPLDKEIGKQILRSIKNDTTITSKPSNWLHSGLPGSKGMYFKLTHGDGAVAGILFSQLSFEYKDNLKNYEGYEDTDSSVVSVTSFGGTEEVIQATRIENRNLDRLMQEDDCSYLRSPAGIFTMAELPIDQINLNDTINAASIKFTRYNDDATTEYINQKYHIGIPQKVLLVRLDEYLDGFFEKYKLYDNQTSYYGTFNKSSNSYEFSNISQLITTILNEVKEGTASENYNKVLLIPVETVEKTSGTTTQIVRINHDFSIHSARLVGGKNDRIKMEIIYSRFK